MKKVTISYYPFRIIRYKRYVEGNFPQSWRELTPTQLIAISSLLKESIEEFRFFEIMTGVKKKVLKKLDSYQLFKIGELLEPFHEIKPYHEFVIKYIETDTERLYPPLPKLKNMPFGQFMFTDTFYFAYMETPKHDALNKFIASLYVPHKTNFSNYDIDKYLPVIQKLEYVFKEAIVINYSLIREWLELSYPIVFVKPTGEQIEKQKLSPKKVSNDGWILIYENMVGDDIVNHDKYSSIPVHNVLRYLTRRIKESRKKTR